MTTVRAVTVAKVGVVAVVAMRRRPGNGRVLWVTRDAYRLTGMTWVVRPISLTAIECGGILVWATWLLICARQSVVPLRAARSSESHIRTRGRPAMVVVVAAVVAVTEVDREPGC